LASRECTRISLLLLSSGSGGWPLKPTAFRPSIGLEIICGIVLLCGLVLTPASAFAQRGAAGAHAGGARPGAARAPQAPVLRSPGAGVSHPTTTSPIITRPIYHSPLITRPTGINAVTTLRSPGAQFRMPLTSIRFPSRPPLRFPTRPIGPFLGTASAFGFGFKPFFFPGCNPFWGVGLGCELLPPYLGYDIGYFPTVYPSMSAYSTDRVYAPPEPSTNLPYTPRVDQYPSLEGLPPEDLTPSSSLSPELRNDTLLYLKDGSVFAVASYTVSDGDLHYVTAYDQRNDVSVDLLDLQKTIDANAARGVAFTLTPAAPASGASKPTPLGPAPAPEGPIIPPKP
jgi:hypothetical protein